LGTAAIVGDEATGTNATQIKILLMKLARWVGQRWMISRFLRTNEILEECDDVQRTS